jgi:ribose transport system substrate-binding protein
MKQLIYIVLFFSLMTGIQTEGLADETAGKTRIVGFAQDTMANDWRIAQVRELEQAFQNYSFIKFFYTDAKGDTATQIKDIEDMISQNVDVLITSPRDAKMMTPVISKAYKKGIPVVLISRRIESEDFTIFIHPDNKQIGKKAAAYIAGKLRGKGNVFILQHIPTTTPAIHRTESFFEEIGKYKGIEIAGMKVANSLRADAIKMTEEALREGLEFDAIYAQSDSMASGARLALKKAGIDPGKIVIVGIDYIKEAREAIRKGEQAASFTYPTGGKEGAEFTLKILQGKTVPKEYIIESATITKENVETEEPIF